VGPDVFLSGTGGVLPSGFAAAKRKTLGFCIAASETLKKNPSASLRSAPSAKA
jgi:hypothetical protein